MIVQLPRQYRRAVGAVLPAAIAGRVRARYAVLRATCERPENGRLRKHLLGHILPGLALYQIGCEEFGREEALAAVRRVFEIVARRSRRQMEFLGLFPWAYAILRICIRPAMRAYPADGWEIEWLETSAKAIRFNSRRCFYHETLSRLGASELTAYFCAMDDLIYDRVSPYFSWQRSQTIGRGAPYCDFMFTRPEAQAGQ